MDFSDWIFATEAGDLIRRIQEEAAQVVVDDIAKEESAIAWLNSLEDDELPIIQFLPLGADDDAPILNYAFDQIFSESHVAGMFTDAQLLLMADYFEKFAAWCRTEAANSSQTP